MNQQKNENYAVFTVCNLAYLPKALVLAASVLKFNGLKLKIVLVEKKCDIDLSKLPADFLWAEDLNIPNFYQLAFKYDIIEFSTSLKPSLSLKFLETHEKVVFLDPDTCMYSGLDPILNDLDKHSIVLTPHYTSPQTDHPEESDVGMMRFGSFNLGFFAIRKSAQGLKFLKWWEVRCFDFCYMESQFGLSTDQKWITIAPCFFEDLHVSFNLGYNAAPWNSFERQITVSKEGIYYVNEKFPLVFFHFSNFDRNDLQYLNKRSHYEKNKQRPDLHELSETYSKELQKNTNEFSKIKYGFDYMSAGEYISPTLRRAYACVLKELPVDHDPFDSSGPVGNFAKANYLLGDSVQYKASGYRELAANQFQIRLIYFVMRVILRLAGPNRFQNLSRLLVFLSSYRQTRGLWKL